MKMKTSKAIILTIIAVLLACYILFPFALVVLNSFKTQAAIVQDPISAAGASFKQFISNLNAVVNNKNFVFWRAFGCSTLVTVISLVLLAVFGGMSAWVICRNKAKWSTVIYMVFISSMIIPFQVVMLPLIATFREVGKFVGLGMNGTLPGLIFAYCGFGGAMTVFILTGFIKGIPYELEEAAAIDGCSPEGTFFRIIFPLLKPTIVTVTILNGMWIWNDYLLPSMERLPAPLHPAWPVESEQDPARCGAGLRRLLRKVLGHDPDGGSARHDSDDRDLPARAEAHHGRYGSGRYQVNSFSIRKGVPIMAPLSFISFGRSAL